MPVRPRAGAVAVGIAMRVAPVGMIMLVFFLCLAGSISTGTARVFLGFLVDLVSVVASAVLATAYVFAFPQTPGVGSVGI